MNKTFLTLFGLLFIFPLSAQNKLRETLNRSQSGSFLSLEKINPNIDDDLVFEFGLQHNFYFHFDAPDTLSQILVIRFQDQSPPLRLGIYQDSTTFHIHSSLNPSTHFVSDTLGIIQQILPNLDSFQKK